MAIVNGSLKDIVNESLASRQGKLIFQLNEPSVAATGAFSGAIYSTAEKSVNAAASTGNFSVDLQTTTSLLNDAWYTLRIEWLDTEGGSMDFPGWQIRVPISGGSIDKLITLGPPNGGWGGSLPNLSIVQMALTRPDNLQVGQLWWKTDPDDPNNLNGKNTGRIEKGTR